MTNVDEEIEKMSQTILSELETAASKDLSTAHYAKKMLLLSDLRHTKGVLLEIQNAPSRAKREIEKRAVIKALLYSTWLQRLYFIIRSFLMGLATYGVTLAFILVFVTIDLPLAIFLVPFGFAFSLVFTRLFDAQIFWVTKAIVRNLANHRTVRDFIFSHF